MCVSGAGSPAVEKGSSLRARSVVSLAISGLITFLLLCHWGFELRGKAQKRGLTDAQMEVRVAGRHFMINVTLFVIDLALLALLASKVVRVAMFTFACILMPWLGELDVPARPILLPSHTSHNRIWVKHLLDQSLSSKFIFSYCRDFYPTHTVTRILLFVFALVGQHTDLDWMFPRSKDKTFRNSSTWQHHIDAGGVFRLMRS